MNANRLPPPSREPQKSHHADRPSGETHGRVEEVGDVDPDARSRKFGHALEEAEQQFEKAKQETPTKPPSPAETVFQPSRSPKKKPSASTPGAPPSSPSSAPPSPKSAVPEETPFSVFTPPDEAPLPQSSRFLLDEDLPEGPIALPPLEEDESPLVPEKFSPLASETPAAPPQKKETPLLSKETEIWEEEFPSAKTHAAPADTPLPSLPPKKQSARAPFEPLSSPAPLPEEPEASPAPLEMKLQKAPFSPPEEKRSLQKEDPLSSPPPSPTHSKPKEAAPREPSLPSSKELLAPLAERRREESRIKKGRVKKRAEEEAAIQLTALRHEKVLSEKQREKRVLEIQGPSLPLLPPEIAIIAQLAAAKTAPYLSPETATLFYQMVGTISLANKRPGVLETEVVLNAPSFAASRFFGSRIVIEKYATAPDSINIRLLGPSAAVDAFRQNIPSLLTAFEKGSFPFRIGRIEASHETERPLFHRKRGPGEDRGNQGSPR